MSGDAATERGDPRQGNAIVRLFRGFGYLFQGWSFVFSKHPSLIKLCLLPFLINLLVFAGAAVGLYFYYGALVDLIWAKPASWFGQIFWYLLYVFIFIAVMLVAYFAFFIVQAILAAPFNDAISEHVELLVAGEQPPPFSLGRLMRGLGRTVAHELLKLLIYAAVIIPLFMANLFVPVLGSLVFVLGGAYMTGLFFGYDNLDFAMARREWAFGRKWRVTREHRALTLGLGGSLATALLVPVLGLLCMPMAAVGGTLLFCDLDRVGAFEPPTTAPAK